jgi:hypothetical protein
VPGAWQNVPAGEWGYSAAFYDDYRYARRPDEQISFGRVFTVKEGANLSFRGEFFNAFNLLVYANPSAGNPFVASTRDARGNLTNGFGWINAFSSGTPRNGQIVLRVQL